MESIDSKQEEIVSQSLKLIRKQWPSNLKSISRFRNSGAGLKVPQIPRQAISQKLSKK